MAFEEIKQGLEKYCKENKAIEMDCVLSSIQSPRVPHNIVYDENYGQWLGHCYDCGQVMILKKGCNSCPYCGHLIFWRD